MLRVMDEYKQFDIPYEEAAELCKFYQTLTRFNAAAPIDPDITN